MNERNIGRLVVWNRVWLSFLVLFLAGLVASNLISNWFKSTFDLSVGWRPSGEIRFSSPSDGPFVVTHLVRYGSSEGEKAVARLPQPIAIVDSRGATIEKNEVAKLIWVDILGQPIAAPKAGSNIKALYYRPEVAIRKY